TTGGTYPEYGNFTTYFLNGDQEWVEVTTRTLQAATGPVIEASTFVDDRFTGGNNVYAGTEELTGPNAALLTSISFISSATSIYYTESDFGGLLTTTFSHRLVGSAYEPPGPYNAETVLVNQITQPLAAVLTTSANVLDVGGSVVLDPVAGGGTAPYTFSYTGVPSGCLPSPSSSWSCAPAGPGLFPVVVTATDANGASLALAPVTIVVNPAPNAHPTSNTSWIDAGENGFVAANAGGGTGALTCSWTVGSVPQPGAPCASIFSFTPTAAGTINVSVIATDGLGRASPVATLLFDVTPPPELSVSPGIGGNVTVGDLVQFRATVAGGAGNASFVWFENATPQMGIPGSVFEFTPSATGTYEISVRATDAAGLTAFAGPFEWVVRNMTSAASPTGSGGSPWSPSLEWIGIGLVLGVAGTLAAVSLAQRRGRKRLQRAHPSRV
ncbi:MAG: PKD domain-containing protein, partial [Thermoplasmata archaeon]|nr:PKD domain-containing protein [Thermoplasmata archaeon]